MSRRHWGLEDPEEARGLSWGHLGPQQARGAAPRSGSMGRSPRKQNGFEVFALGEIGSPESNANNPEYLFLNEHQFFLFLVLLFS